MLLAAGAATQRDLATGQTSLFDVGAADAMVMERPLPSVPEAPVRERLRWEDTGKTAWKEFTLERSSPIAEVQLDPDGDVLTSDPLPLYRRVVGDPRASYRAASRLGFWTQTLMQAVGL